MDLGISELDRLPGTVERSADDAIDPDMVRYLWERIAKRLRDGEALVVPQQFAEAMAAEYGQRTGRAPGRALRRRLLRMIETVNRRHPETYVALGLQNAVDRAFGRGVITLSWNEEMVQANGARSIRRFTRRDTVRDLLDDVSLSPAAIDVTRSVQVGVRAAVLRGSPSWTQGREAPVPLPSGSGAAQVPGKRQGAGVDSPSPPAAPPVPEEILRDPTVAAAVESGDVAQDEAVQRVRLQDQRASVLREQEMEHLGENLKIYVTQGLLTPQEARQVRALQQVDARAASGEIAENEAERARSKVVDPAQQAFLSRKVDAVVDQTVRYMQVFESMQKIDPALDEALRFLIQNKHLVTSEELSSTAVEHLIEQLDEDDELLALLLELVERRDHEVRMISVRLPPYNQIVRRSGIERIKKMTIEEDFLELLRNATAEQISARLHSPERSTRARLAADIRCLISLIDHATRRTAFRKEIRLIRLRDSIRQFYLDNDDVEAAREQAEMFVKRRLRSIFPDLSREETALIREQSTRMIEQIEAQVQEGRKDREENTAERHPADGGNEQGQGQLDISDEERAAGALLGRVRVRVAGTLRPVLHRLMPDPEDPDRYVIATRDEETGGLVPQMRRGAKRYVERDRSGLWKLV